MRWVLTTVGSRGDVQPFVALARGLMRAGHLVTLAALEPHRALVTANGVAFTSLGALPPRFSQTPRFKIPFHGLAGRTAFWLLYRDLLAHYLPRFADVCRGAEGLIFSGLAFPIYHVAQMLGVPAVAVTLVPHAPTRAFVDPFFARHPLAGVARFNTTSATLENQLMLQVSAGPINNWRADTLGLPRVPRTQWSQHRQTVVGTQLHAYSRRVLPTPHDWSSDITVTGFWTLPEDPTFVPAPALVDFVRGGTRPLYAGFGSMTPGTAERLYRQLITAALACDQRLLVLADGTAFDVQGLAEHMGMTEANFHLASATPHDWLLPRVALAIHHGGIGTVAATHRAGVPSIIIPHNFDQFFWAQRVVALGTGLAPGRWRGANTDWLCAAIRRLTDDLAVRRATTAMQRHLVKEDGVDRAIQVLETLRPQPTGS